MSGLLLKLTRIEKGIRQLELARMTQISHNTLSMFENDWKKPTRAQAEAINAALGKEIFKVKKD
jgi:transcriptional regulator with XRE-family HTH domain